MPPRFRKRQYSAAPKRKSLLCPDPHPAQMRCAPSLACPVAAAASRYLGVLFSSPPRNHTPGCFRTPPSSGGTELVPASHYCSPGACTPPISNMQGKGGVLYFLITLGLQIFPSHPIISHNSRETAAFPPRAWQAPLRRRGREMGKCCKAAVSARKAARETAPICRASPQRHLLLEALLFSPG